MSRSEDVLRTLACKILPYVPPFWAHWFRNRVVLKNVLDKLSINCVIDVGANQGQFGTLLRRIGYRGWIVSFEPVHASYELLEKLAAKEKLWRAFPYALGAENERREINVTDETVFSSFLAPLEESQVRFQNNRVERREEVHVRRLDQILDTCLTGIPSPRIYLKLDTQGFDLAVMEGAQNILPSLLGIQTEVSFHNIYQGMPSFAESISKFQAAGFEPIDFITVNRDVDQLCAIEMDCIMTRKPNWVRGASKNNQAPETR